MQVALAEPKHECVCMGRTSPTHWQDAVQGMNRKPSRHGQTLLKAWADPLKGLFLAIQPRAMQQG